MKKVDIIKSWYPNEVLSDDEALAIYDRLLKLYLTLYYADKENKENSYELTCDYFFGTDCPIFRTNICCRKSGDKCGCH